MIRSIVFPRVLGKSLTDLQPALDLFRALGFAPGNQWHERDGHGLEMLAPSGGIELIAATDLPSVDATVEVSDADAAFAIVKKLAPTLPPKTGDEDGAPVQKSGVKIQREISDTPYGARLFEVEVGGLRIGFLTYAKKPSENRGLEGKLDARGKSFALVISRFNSFITERLLDGALQALRQCGAKPDDITIVHVPGAFEIPSVARQLAESKRHDAIICIGCLLRGDTLHYEVIANEVARGIGQSAQETGVPHALGVLTCDTLQQAIDRAGLKAGNKGFEAGLAAVEMACLREQITKSSRPRRKKGTADPSAALRSARDDKAADPSATAAKTAASARDDKGADPSAASAEATASVQDDQTVQATGAKGEER
jgi:6,7-dimethyl-8-ribityllumazine synthase